MLKQGFVQEKVNDLAVSHRPPHLMNNYPPQWSRVNTLDKARYPKPFVKDKMQANMEVKRDLDDDDTALEASEVNTLQRAQYLERSLVFLKRQHQDILRSLHEEIDALKRENKDLQFRIVMSQRQPRYTKSEKKTNEDGEETRDVDNESTSDSLQSKLEEESIKSRAEKLDEIKVVFMEEELKELKHALRETRNRNTYLSQLLEQSEEQRRRQHATVESMKVQMTQGGIVPGNQTQDQTAASHPFQQGSRPLTLAECHSYIRNLQQQNEQQSHELESLKSDLRDVLYSHKWTPDAYLLAKAYIAEDDLKEAGSSKSALPRIPLKHPTRKLPDIAYIQRDNVSLPALKHTVSNRAIERRKRTQILQKARLRNEVIP